MDKAEQRIEELSNQAKKLKRARGGLRKQQEKAQEKQAPGLGPQKPPVERLVVSYYKEPSRPLYACLYEEALAHLPFCAFLLKILTKCSHFHLMFLRQNPRVPVDDEAFRVFREAEKELREAGVRDEGHWHSFRTLQRQAEQRVRALVEKVYWRAKQTVEGLASRNAL